MTDILGTDCLEFLKTWVPSGLHLGAGQNTIPAAVWSSEPVAGVLQVHVDEGLSPEVVKQVLLMEPRAVLARMAYVPDEAGDAFTEADRFGLPVLVRGPAGAELTGSRVVPIGAEAVLVRPERNLADDEAAAAASADARRERGLPAYEPPGVAFPYPDDYVRSTESQLYTFAQAYELVTEARQAAHDAAGELRRLASDHEDTELRRAAEKFQRTHRLQQVLDPRSLSVEDFSRLKRYNRSAWLTRETLLVAADELQADLRQAAHALRGAAAGLRVLASAAAEGSDEAARELRDIAEHVTTELSAELEDALDRIGSPDADVLRNHLSTDLADRLADDLNSRATHYARTADATQNHIDVISVGDRHETTWRRVSRDVAREVIDEVRQRLQVGPANHYRTGEIYQGEALRRLATHVRNTAYQTDPDDTDVLRQIARNAYLGNYFGLGNCGEFAALTFSLLWNDRRLTGIPIAYVDHDIDHVFVVVGPPGHPNSLVVDPWTWRPSATTVAHYFLDLDRVDLTTYLSDGSDLLQFGREQVKVELLPQLPALTPADPAIRVRRFRKARYYWDTMRSYHPDLGTANSDSEDDETGARPPALPDVRGLARYAPGNRPGLALLDAGQEAAITAAGTFRAATGEYPVFVHGTIDGPVVADTLVTPEELSALIAADPQSRGKTIVLIQCASGAALHPGNDFATRLLPLLPVNNARVLAMGGTAWVQPPSDDSTELGEVLVTPSPVVGRDGRPRLSEGGIREYLPAPDAVTDKPMILQHGPKLSAARAGQGVPLTDSHGEFIAPDADALARLGLRGRQALRRSGVPFAPSWTPDAGRPITVPRPRLADAFHEAASARNVADAAAAWLAGLAETHGLDRLRSAAHGFRHLHSLRMSAPHLLAPDVQTWLTTHHQDPERLRADLLNEAQAAHATLTERAAWIDGQIAGLAGADAQVWADPTSIGDHLTRLAATYLPDQAGEVVGDVVRLWRLGRLAHRDPAQENDFVVLRQRHPLPHMVLTSRLTELRQAMTTHHAVLLGAATDVTAHAARVGAGESAETEWLAASQEIAQEVIAEVTGRLRYGPANNVRTVNRYQAGTEERLRRIRGMGTHSALFKNPGDTNFTNALARRAWMADAFQTGNCDEYAALTLSLLWNRLHDQGVPLSHVHAKAVDQRHPDQRNARTHIFVVIGPLGHPNSIVVDPWPYRPAPATVANYFVTMGSATHIITALPDAVDLLEWGRQQVHVDRVQEELQALGVLRRVPRDQRTSHWTVADDSDWLWSTRHSDNRPQAADSDSDSAGTPTRWAASEPPKRLHESPQDVVTYLSEAPGLHLLGLHQRPHISAAESFRTAAGEYAVFVEGTMWGPVVDGKLVTAEQLRDLIVADPRSAGQDIVLVSCDLAVTRPGTTPLDDFATGLFRLLPAANKRVLGMGGVAQVWDDDVFVSSSLLGDDGRIRLVSGGIREIRDASEVPRGADVRTPMVVQHGPVLSRARRGSGVALTSLDGRSVLRPGPGALAGLGLTNISDSPGLSLVEPGSAHAEVVKEFRAGVNQYPVFMDRRPVVPEDLRDVIVADPSSAGQDIVLVRTELPGDDLAERLFSLLPPGNRRLLAMGGTAVVRPVAGETTDVLVVREVVTPDGRVVFSSGGVREYVAAPEGGSGAAMVFQHGASLSAVRFGAGVALTDARGEAVAVSPEALRGLGLPVSEPVGVAFPHHGPYQYQGAYQLPPNLPRRLGTYQPSVESRFFTFAEAYGLVTQTRRAAYEAAGELRGSAQRAGDGVLGAAAEKFRRTHELQHLPDLRMLTPEAFAQLKRENEQWEETRRALVAAARGLRTNWQNLVGIYTGDASRIGGVVRAAAWGSGEAVLDLRTIAERVGPEHLADVDRTLRAIREYARSYQYQTSTTGTASAPDTLIAGLTHRLVTGLNNGARTVSPAATSLGPLIDAIELGGGSEDTWRRVSRDVAREIVAQVQDRLGMPANNYRTGELYQGQATARVIQLREQRYLRNPAETDRFAILAADAYLANHFGVGRCSEFAALAFALLWSDRRLTGIPISFVTHDVDHAFVVVGPPGHPNSLVVDPWPWRPSSTTVGHYFLGLDGATAFTGTSDGSDMLGFGRERINVHLLPEREHLVPANQAGRRFRGQRYYWETTTPNSATTPNSDSDEDLSALAPPALAPLGPLVRYLPEPRRGLTLLDPGRTAARAAAETFRAAAAEYPVFVHGTMDGPVVANRLVTAAELRDLIVADPRSRDRTIILVQCGSGAAVNPLVDFASWLFPLLPSGNRRIFAMGGTAWVQPPPEGHAELSEVVVTQAPMFDTAGRPTLSGGGVREYRLAPDTHTMMVTQHGPRLSQARRGGGVPLTGHDGRPVPPDLYAWLALGLNGATATGVPFSDGVTSRSDQAFEVRSDVSPGAVAIRYPELDRVNVHRHRGGEYQQNCVLSAFATAWMLENGDRVMAPPSGPQHLGDLARFVAQHQRINEDEVAVWEVPGFAAIRDAMADAELPLSRGFVAVRSTGSTDWHVYVVVRDEHGVSFLDGQAGGLAATRRGVTEVLFVPLDQRIPPPRGATALPSEFLDRRPASHGAPPGPVQLAGRGGVEAEDHGGWLATPDDVVLSREPFVARHAASGVDVVADTGYFFSTPDGRDRQNQFGVLKAPDETLEHEEILEFKNSRPFRLLPGEVGGDPRITFDLIRHTVNRMSLRPIGEPIPLTRLFPAAEGWELNPRAATTFYHSVGPGNIPHLSMHYSVGVPLAALRQFLRRVEPDIFMDLSRQYGLPSRDVVRAAEEFTERASQEILADRDLDVRDRAEVEGVLALTYTQAAAMALSKGASGISKNLTGVVSRHAPATLYAALSEPAQEVLGSSLDVIRALFEQSVQETFNEQDPWRDTDTWTYLASALQGDPQRTLTPRNTLGVHTWLRELDSSRRGQPPLAVVEVRYYLDYLTDTLGAENAYRRLEGLVQEVTGEAARAQVIEPVVLPAGVGHDQVYWIGKLPPEPSVRELRAAAGEVDVPVVHLGARREGDPATAEDLRDLRRLLEQFSLKRQQPVVVTRAARNDLMPLSEIYGFSVVNRALKRTGLVGGLLGSGLSQPVWQVVKGDIVEDRRQSIDTQTVRDAAQLVEVAVEPVVPGLARLLLTRDRERQQTLLREYEDVLAGATVSDQLTEIIERTGHDSFFARVRPLLENPGRFALVRDVQDTADPAGRKARLLENDARDVSVDQRVRLLADSGFDTRGAATALHAVELLLTESAGLPEAVAHVRANSGSFDNLERQSWVDAIDAAARGHEDRRSEFQQLAEAVLTC